MKVDIAQQLVLSERIVVVENVVVPTYQFADFFSLVIDLGRAS